MKLLRPVLWWLLAAGAVMVAALAWWRVRQADLFSAPLRVETFGGTNYIIQLTAATVGRVQTGYLVIVTARLENPNPFEVLLQRDWFVLTDESRDYFQPNTNGTQTAIIRIPPGGRLEREMFSYTVSGDSFKGWLALMAGHQRLIPIKSRQPYHPHLNDGEFVTFRRRDW